ncbi:hydantoinase B/oxoprolinase family protein [Alcaligenaceae bacterium]|nr:hydantoinase B/oxoprolinase family protein [Alcaligenaceae bacterium]
MKTGTTEIVSSALNACTKEMLASLIRTAYSPNIKERGDCSTAICDIQGRTLSLAANAPAHLGATLRLVPQILKRFPPEVLRPGDVFLANDPYIVGVTHLNDCTVAVPVFVDGQPVAFAIAVAHHSDVGGRVPGSEAGDSVSIFQEGIRIPPLRIYTAGKKNADVIELFLLNSRTPHFGQGDLAAQVAAVDRGATRLGELYGKHGRSNMEKSLDDMLAGTEKRVMEKIRSGMRPGVYTADDWLDEDGVSDNPVHLAATISIDSHEIIIDLSGCNDQIGSGKNIPWPHTLATVYCVLKSFVDPGGPINEGLFRAVRVIAPEGLVVNPIAPAAVSSRNITSMILADVLMNAIGQSCPERQVAYSGPFQGTILSGKDPRNQVFFIDYENFCGGQGATRTNDGMDAVHVHMTNTSNLPVESMELEFPVIVERYELIEDSGGAGEYRGGMGILRDFRLYGEDMAVALRSARQKFPAKGINGGRHGSLGAFILNPGTPQEKRLPSTSSATPLRKGDLLRIMTPGGGGMGDPAHRRPEAIRSDYLQGKISSTAIKNEYGQKTP